MGPKTASRPEVPDTGVAGSSGLPSGTVFGTVWREKYLFETIKHSARSTVAKKQLGPKRNSAQMKKRLERRNPAHLIFARRKCDEKDCSDDKSDTGVGRDTSGIGWRDWCPADRG